MKNFAKNTLFFILTLMVIFPFASCSALDDEGASEIVADSETTDISMGGGTSENTPAVVPIVDGTLKVAIELGGFSAGGVTARSAAPSGIDENLVFGAVVSASGSSAGLKLCTYDSTEKLLEIPFALSDTARENYTLDIYAFENGTTINASTNATSALLYGSTKISIPANSLTATLSDSVVKLFPKSGNGTVELKITLTSADYTLSCSDTTNFTITGTSPNCVIKNAGSGIASRAYPVTLKVSKGSNVVYTRNETINVYSGMKTDVWLLGDGASTPSETIAITASEIASTFYVCGTGSAWFTALGVTSGDDTTGNGSLGKPYATINKAIDVIKATTTAAATNSFTIYVDGTFTTTNGATAVADFSGITGGCSITLKGLDATAKATIDGKDTAQGIKVGSFDGSTETKVNLNLTLENLVITKCVAERGGGISLVTETANTHTISNCEISDNTATENGGGIYNYNGTVTMSDGTISGNSAKNGGGIYNDAGTFTLNGGTIGNSSATTVATSLSACSNKATETGGGIYNNGGTVTLVGGNIFYNYAGTNGGGIYNSNSTNSKLVMGSSSTTTIKYNYCGTSGGGIYSGNTFTMQDGTITNNEARNGGGIFIAYGSTTTVSGGTISNNTATRNLSNASGGQGICVWQGTLQLEGGAKIDSSNNIRLMGRSDDVTDTDPHLKITGNLTATGTVATIYPKSYTASNIVLEGDATLVSANYNKFAVTPQTVSGSGVEWEITSTGLLKRKCLETLYLGGGNADRTSDSDDNSGKDASHALKTLKAAYELLDYSAENPKIIVCSQYTLASDETSCLDFSSKVSGDKKVTILRNEGFGGVNSNGLKYHLIVVDTGTATLKNVILDGNNRPSDESGSLLKVGTSTVTVGENTVFQNNNVNGGGGGIVLFGNGTLDIGSGCVIQNNTSTIQGKGIYINSGTFNVSGGFQLPADQDIFLNGKVINITGNLTGTMPVATIQPASYNTVTQVLSGSYVSSNYSKFAVKNESNGTRWKIGSNGYLDKKSGVEIASELESGPVNPTDITESIVTELNNSNSKVSVTLTGNGSDSTGTAFTGANCLKSIVISSGITTIDNNAFKGCNSLTSITIENGVQTIGDSAFDSSSKIESFEIPDSVTTIGKKAFYGLNGASSDVHITIGTGIDSIGDSAFENGAKIKTITIKATKPPTLGSNVFLNCTSITTIYVPSANVEDYKSKAGWSAFASKIVGF